MIGKIIGAVIGFVTLNIVGLFLGIFVGHFFDKGLPQLGMGLSPEQKRELEQRFINTLFPLLGHMAKADGRVSEAEIAHTESLMSKYGMTDEHRDQAINLFKVGTEAIFTPASVVKEFFNATHSFPDLRKVLLTYLIGIAMADGQIHPNEADALREIAAGLGFDAAAFEQMLAMLRAQGQFRGQSAPPRGDELRAAYVALGVDEGATDAEVKKAYRKLMSENHPDKLMGQGVPDDMIKIATERAQEVQRAYDMVRKARKN